MLSPRLSVVEQIFACDEGVMGLHNDRRTGGKMPANGSQEVILFHYFTKFFLIAHRDLSFIKKVASGSLILDAFRLATQSCTPSTLLSSQVKNQLKLSDLGVNIC